jgi:hypothetical protein
MISRLLALLLLFLRPAIDGADGADGADAGDAGGSGDAPDGADDIEIDTDSQDAADSGSSAAPDDAARLAAELANERAERARDRERAERYEREAADLRVRHAKPPTNTEWDREEEILKDPNATDQQKWTVNANRQLRANTHLAQSSMAAAADVNDRTAFAGVCMSDPLAKKYEKRVEEELTKIRAQGGNVPPREAVYTFLLGRDMRDGKYKKKTPAASASANGAPRGRTPGVKSDVSGRGSQLTEHEKRRQRLENIQI